MPARMPNLVPGTASLADFTDASLIVPCLRERDMAGAIKELVELLHAGGWISDILPFYHAAMTREFLSSTAMECGLAFPHARTSGSDRLRFAFGRSRQPFAWGSPGNPRVQFVFVVAAPSRDSPCYLRLLSGLGHLGKTESLLGHLGEADTADRVLAALRQVEIGVVESAPVAAC
ncbi:MAG: PTS sugar transporter subunit IIA [Verrucomicrobia bacterium]|nr:PTS sugar transporter subunit IIA [Verrucomicrobiota bacterium]